jgi:hypothetical protein
MKLFISLLAAAALTAVLPAAGRGAVTESRSFKISVTIPRHITYTEAASPVGPPDPLALFKVVEYDLRNIEWTEIARNNERLIVRSVVLK